MSRLQNSFWTPPWPQKIKNDPKIKSKSKVRIEENIENKSFSTTWVDPKIVFQPYPEGTIENKSFWNLPRPQT